MRLVKFLLVLLIIVMLAGCQKANKAPILSNPEQTFLNNVKQVFKAEKLKLGSLQQNDTVIQNSLRVTLQNCKVIKPDDGNLALYSGAIIDSLLAQSGYTKKYNSVAIVFEQNTGIWPFYNQQTTSFVWKKQQIDSLIARRLNPLMVAIDKVVLLESQQHYSDLILLGDSLIQRNSAYVEIGEQALGIGYLNLKDSMQALKHFYLAAQADPQNATNYEDISLLYSGLRDYKKALITIDSAIAILPEKGELYYLRGAYQHETGKDSAACKDVKKAQALGFSGASALVLSYCK